MAEGTNRLAGEKSPYLLQHAHDPVDWYSWGPEPFERARSEDKPVFLSIGYSTCHWCHVMARESFASPEIAALLNSWCISIKVDREERPDVDQLYMAAIQAMNGSGGWPLSIFLFPDGRPFYTATYIPAEPKQGRPGFADILRAVHRVWQSRRVELLQAADKLILALTPSAPDTTPAVPPDVGHRAFRYLVDTFDNTHGGFDQAPKFPRPAAYDFLLRWWCATGEPAPLEMVRTSLSAMAAGGLHDHFGGGFHRYCVDRSWLVPHFEKMLYDQAQLASVYLDMYRITGASFYGEIVRDVLGYVLRDLRAEGGGFFPPKTRTALIPAEQGGQGEGTFYLWTHGEISGILGTREGEIFSFCYGVRPEGNVTVDPQGEFQGKNILYLATATLEAFGPALDRFPGGLVTMLCGWLEQQEKPVQVIVAGRRHNGYPAPAGGGPELSAWESAPAGRPGRQSGLSWPPAALYPGHNCGQGPGSSPCVPGRGLSGSRCRPGGAGRAVAKQKSVTNRCDYGSSTL